MEIQEEAVKEALGENAGRLFMALAGIGAPRHLEAFGGRIDEYMRFLEDHLRIERYQELRASLDLELATRIADTYRTLLGSLEGADDPRFLLVATGVRYFVTPTDVAGDLEERGGFRDDLAVLRYVLEAGGFDVEAPAEA